MKKTIWTLVKAVGIIIVVLWIGLILVEYGRYRNNEPMLVKLKEETKTYDDGIVHISYGLGYKVIIYERTSLYGKQFGHIFIQVREEAPKNG